MLLVIDIGNTSITLGIMNGQSAVHSYQIKTTIKRKILNEELRGVLRTWHRRYPFIKGGIISSVVPQVLKIVEPIVSQQLKKKVIVIGRDMMVPIINRYSPPGQVGQDRLVCAYAAMRFYGTPVIIIDLGTAITLDVVSRKKEYLGGIIVPGIQLSTETLFQKAALLPKVKIRQPRSLIGKNTQGSILSGIFYGYGEMIQGLITLIAKEINGKPKVIVTGGYTSLMKKYIAKRITIIDKDLVLKGMDLLWQEQLAAMRNPS